MTNQERNAKEARGESWRAIPVLLLALGLVMGSGCGDDGGDPPMMGDDDDDVMMAGDDDDDMMVGDDDDDDDMMVGDDDDDDDAPLDCSSANRIPPAPIACGDDGDPPCGDGTTCVRGACLADCGGDPTVFDQAVVASEVAFLANVCQPEGSFDTGPARNGLILALVAEDDRFDVGCFGVGAGNGVLTLADETSVTVDPLLPDSAAIPTAFVAQSPDARRVAVGYTQIAEGSIPGEILVLDGTESPAVFEAPGNFDATWLDAGALLVNGLGFGGDGTDPAQGLYAIDLAGDARRRLIGGPAGASGSVGVTPAGLVLYGFLDEAFANTIAAVAASELGDILVASSDSEAGAPIPLADDARLTARPGPSSFVVVGRGNRIVARRFNDDFTATLFDIHSVVGSDAASFSLGDPLALAEPVEGSTVITGAVSAVDDLVFLRHEQGLLLVDLGDTGSPD